MPAIDQKMLRECVAENIALLTQTLHDGSDEAAMLDALELVHVRDGETLNQWINRLATFIVSAVAIEAGLIEHAAELSGLSAETIIQGLALGAARRD